MEPRNKTDYIVIHCAATKASMDIGTNEITDWHVNGNGWRDIGYHKVIRRNGVIENGRDLRDSGAHAAGYNHKSVGVCLVGGMADDNSAENNFTDQQWTALVALIKELKTEYPDADIIGHNEISQKECPSFNVQEWKEGNI
jgi:N-acetyl-anhydromuramyl-L-alanine amidase AmpD|tara:strand:- start:107 stop:529 length:423 start_codon:yes stop_codon:yes gene_type:complete